MSQRNGQRNGRSQRRQSSEERDAQRTARNASNIELTRRVADALEKVEYTLPDEWWKHCFPCAECGEENFVAFKRGPHKVQVEVRGQNRYLIAAWCHVETTIKKGRPHMLCQACSFKLELRLRQAKLEELLSTEVKTEDEAWKHEEMQAIRPCISMYHVCEELQLRATSEDNAVSATVLGRRDEIVPCANGCGHSGPLSAMKALTRVPDPDGSGEIYTIELLISQATALVEEGAFSTNPGRNKTVVVVANHVGDDVIGKHQASDDYRNPIFVCASCAVSVVHALIAGQRYWDVQYQDGRGVDRRKGAFEPALDTVRRMTSSQVRQQEGNDDRFEEAEVKLGFLLEKAGVVPSAVSEPEQSEPEEPEPTPEEIVHLNERGSSKGNRHSPRPGGKKARKAAKAAKAAGNA